MEIRNSIVVARALVECKKLGISSVCTGDGADELFAGYSFLHKMPQEALKEYLCHMATIMRFSGPRFGKKLGIKVHQPFMDKEVIEFALSCERSDLIIARNDGSVFGKFILREAYPDVVSCWRVKEPIEVGSGTCALPGLVSDYVTDDELRQEIRRIGEEDKVKIRDKEHLLYYRTFRTVFASVFENGITDGFEDILPPRFGTDPCIACGFQLQTPNQKFCVVCGEYPARL